MIMMKRCTLIVLTTMLLLQDILGINTTLNDISANVNGTDLVEFVLLNDAEDPCARKCTNESTPMTCRYRFNLEWYDTMSKACYQCPFVTEDCYRMDCIPADGNKRPVLVVNRQMPGPSIQICQGDEVIVDVENQLASESTTVHWHGQHQKNNPYMDGVPFVTQCPIPPGNTFRYQFKAENAGTHFWHSHTGMQRADGVFGSFIVRVPENENPHSSLYDFDLRSHVIILLDWGNVIGMQKFVSHHHNTGDNKPMNLLINGLGRFKEFEPLTNRTSVIPSERFVVQKGYRYRMRIINAGFLNCPIEVSIDNHTLTVISSDGNDFEPIIAESVVTYAGERFDFVLHADQEEDVYWMRFRGLMDCDERFKSAHQVAVLQYQGVSNDSYPEGNPDYNAAHKEGTQVNSLNRGTEGNNSFVSAPGFAALNKWDESLKDTPDLKYYVSYDFYKIDNPHFHRAPYYGFKNITDPSQLLLTPQLNFISMKLQPFPLMSQRHEIKEEMLCNETTVKNCQEEYCECTHTVKVALNSVVEMILIDKGVAFDANHPFHLHGHSFRVIAMEKIGSNVTVAEVYRRDKEGLINRNLVNPPIKDTVTVPDGGYTVVRFHATNPGFWLFHCHIEFHAEVGMALVFKVGEDQDMRPVPKNFPTCGNYMPEERKLPLCTSVSTLEKLENYVPSIFGMKCIANNGATFFILSSHFAIMSFLFILFR